MSSLLPEVGVYDVFDDCRGSMHVLDEDCDFHTKIIKMTTSVRGVLRGFHYQSFPLLQRKKIYVLEGEIQDVCLEIDGGFPTGKYFETLLRAEGPNNKLFVPSNWAHAYLTLSPRSRVLYVCDRAYGNEISFNPFQHFSDWKISGYDLIVSEKDAK